MLLTAVLIALVILAISVPIYWQTRLNMERQLTRFMESNLTLIQQNMDRAQLTLLTGFFKAPSLQTRLDSVLKVYLKKLDLRSIYLVNPHGVILYCLGDSQGALQSVMRHQNQIQDMPADAHFAAPLFKDKQGTFIKSVFTNMALDGKNAIILGIDANALFLEKAAVLRKQLIYIGIFVLGVSLLLASILSQTLTRPLDRLTHYARQIGKGRPVSFGLRKRRDEIGFLGQTMQTMQNNIKQREKENKQLIASIAHEIKNPLGGMRINAELLLEEAKKHGPLYKYGNAIHGEIKHLSEIVNTFLNYARPLDQNVEESELHEVLLAARGDVQQEHNTERVKIKGQAGAFIHPGKMRRAFYNLIKNACEASKEDTPIVISVVRSGAAVMLHFINYGDPIPLAYQSQIFDAFFTTRETGVGLGLSIAKSIVEQHGGELYLDHSDETGTEFVIQLPVKKE